MLTNVSMKGWVIYIYEHGLLDCSSKNKESGPDERMMEHIGLTGQCT